MTKQEANKIKSDIMSGKSVTFKSQSDAIGFIKQKFSSFPKEIAKQRSSQGWHLDSHEIGGVIRDHINIYSKSPKFNDHIFLL